MATGTPWGLKRAEVHLEHLSVVDFRSYPAADVTLCPGITVLLGGNGHGKTNLLEAVGYVATLASHRVAADAPLVRSGAERAVIRARIRRGERVATTDIEISPGSAVRVQINRVAVPRPRRSSGLLRAVTFAPEDLAIVRGDPDGRRRFLDDLLVARTPRFAGVRADYDRVVRQRTALLKSARASSSAARSAAMATLDVWDSHLVAAGAELLCGRLDVLAALDPYLRAAYEAVSGHPQTAQADYVARGVLDDAELAGMDRADAERLLARSAGERRTAEIDRGTCLVGPHRDDLLLSIGGLPTRGYASHGESWSMALALRLAAFDLLRSDGDAAAEPVLILDDVFAELDSDRRRHLMDRATSAEQALISAAVADDVPMGLTARTWQVTRDRATGVSQVREAT